MVVEWSAHLAGKQAFRIRRPLAKLSMMHILYFYNKKNKEIAEKTSDEDVQKLK